MSDAPLAREGFPDTLLGVLEDAFDRDWARLMDPCGSARDRHLQTAVSIGLMRRLGHFTGDRFHMYAPTPLFALVMRLRRSLHAAFPALERTCDACLSDERRKGREEEFPPGRLVYEAGQIEAFCSLLGHAHTREPLSDVVVIGPMVPKRAPNGGDHG
jgi:hypothetical protein